jgi:hypothetical protein
MAHLVYLLAGLTSLACAALLTRAYLRTRMRLLAWTALCFFGLTVNNVILVFDVIVFPDVELSVVRNASAVVAIFLMVAGLIWEAT